VGDHRDGSRGSGEAMKSRTSRNPCALCGGHEWYCYDSPSFHSVYAVPIGEEYCNWRPIVDFLGDTYLANPGWYDECVNCKAVVS